MGVLDSDRHVVEKAETLALYIICAPGSTAMMAGRPHCAYGTKSTRLIICNRKKKEGDDGTHVLSCERGADRRSGEKNDEWNDILSMKNIPTARQTAPAACKAASQLRALANVSLSRFLHKRSKEKKKKTSVRSTKRTNA